MSLILGCLCLATTMCPLQAQELLISGGGLQSCCTADTTYTWQIGYRDYLCPDLALSFTWNNEGHLPEHHRDGGSLQAWFMPSRHCHAWSIAFGLGIYRYNDTIPAQQASHQNKHGVGIIGSCQAVVPLKSSAWDMFLQVNSIRIPRELGTNAVQTGMIYHLDKPTAAEHPITKQDFELPPNVLNLYFGQSVLNSLKSEVSDAWVLEYRRKLTGHLQISISFTNEGETPLLRRVSVGTPLYLSRTFMADRLHLEVGGGPCLSRVTTSEGDLDEQDRFWHLSMRSSLGVGWRLTPAWMARANWYRTFSNYDRDTDLFVAGLGYLW